MAGYFYVLEFGVRFSPISDSDFLYDEFVTNPFKCADMVIPNLFA